MSFIEKNVLKINAMLKRLEFINSTRLILLFLAAMVIYNIYLIYDLENLRKTLLVSHGHILELSKQLSSIEDKHFLDIGNRNVDNAFKHPASKDK